MKCLSQPHSQVVVLKTREGKTAIGAIDLGNHVKGADFSKSAGANIFDVIVHAIFADGGYFATAQV